MIDGNKEGWQEPANTLNNPIPNNNVTHFICDVNNKNIGLPDGQSLTSDEWQSVFSAWQHWGLIGNDAVNSDTSLDTNKHNLSYFYDNENRYIIQSVLNKNECPVKVKYYDGWTCPNGYVVKCWDTQENKVVYFYIPCNKRTCPACQKRLSWKIYKRIEPLVRQLLSNSGDMRLRMLTLTLRGSDDKFDDVQFFHKCLNRLWWRLKKKKLMKKYNVMGLIGAYEFGSKSLNLHIHCLIYSRFIPQKEISDLWNEITNSRGKIVDVRNLIGLDGVKEVLKYASKLKDLTDEQKNIIEMALRGTRRIVLKGIFYNITKHLEDRNELREILNNKRYIFMDIMSLDSFCFYEGYSIEDIFIFDSG